MSNSVGAKLIASVLADKKGVDSFIKMGLPTEWFLGNDSELYDFVEHHVNEYGVLPAEETIYKQLDIELPKTKEPPKYYADHLEKRYLQTVIKKEMLEAQNFLKTKDPHQALDTLETLISDMVLAKNHKHIVNFKEDAGKLIHQDNVQKKLHGDEYGVTMGWDYMDNMTGGLVGGDLLSIVGRPATGKSYLLFRMAYKAWLKGKTPFVVSTEMAVLPIIHRLVAMHTKVPITKLKNATLGTKTYNTKVKGVMQMVVDSNMPPFWIIDGNLAITVKEIKTLVKQLKPDAAYIDGAYLLEPSGIWVRGPGAIVKDTCEGLKKHVAGDMDIPVTASYQFNRDQTKNKKNLKQELEMTGLEHIAGGDAIGQISSIVLGLFQEDTVETMMKKHIKVLKGRSGEVGGFDINWKFDVYPFMDFDEIKEEHLEDMQFVN